MTTFIYVLKEPDTGEVRYVGKSDNPKSRFYQHKSDARLAGNHREAWISSLLKRGLLPALETVDEVPVEEWPSWECAYIQFYRDVGCDLTNATEGGESPMSGKTHSVGAREKMSLSRRGERNHNFGRKLPTEQVVRMVETRRISYRKEQHPNFGKPLQERTREKISFALRGAKSPNYQIPLPGGVRAELSAAQRNHWAKMTPEQREYRRSQMRAGWERRGAA